MVLVSSPTVAEECFTKNDIAFANRPQLLAGKNLGYNYTNIVWASYGQHWRNLRRIASLELLSSHRLQMFYSIRVDEVFILFYFYNLIVTTIWNEELESYFFSRRESINIIEISDS